MRDNLSSYHDLLTFADFSEYMPYRASGNISVQIIELSFELRVFAQRKFNDLTL